MERKRNMYNKLSNIVDNRRVLLPSHLRTTPQKSFRAPTNIETLSDEYHLPGHDSGNPPISARSWCSKVCLVVKAEVGWNSIVRIGQDGPARPPRRRSKMPSRSAKMAQRWPQDGPKDFQAALRGPLGRPSWGPPGGRQESKINDTQ